MHLNKITLFGIATFAVLGTIFSLSAPLLFVSYLEVGIINESAIGWLSGMNLFGMVLGCLLSLYYLQNIPVLKLAQWITISIAILCWLCSLLMSTWVIYPNLLVLGILQGILYARTFSAFANLPQPIRGYAMYQVALAILGIFCFYAIPRLIPILGIHTGFYLITGLALFSFCFALYYRHISFGKQAAKGIPFSMFKDPKIMGLIISIMLFQAADMSIWIYLERIAHANTISTNFVSLVLILAFLAGMVTAWLVDKFSDSKGLRLPLFVGMACTLLMLIRLLLPMDQWEYALVSIIFNMAWVVTYTYMLSLQAHYDKSGKIVTIGVTANFIGEGLGPLLTGTLLLFFPLTITAWVAIVLIILSALFIFPLVTSLVHK